MHELANGTRHFSSGAFHPIILIGRGHDGRRIAGAAGAMTGFARRRRHGQLDLIELDGCCFLVVQVFPFVREFWEKVESVVDSTAVF